jgi:predicted metal-dependent hydrolase
VNIHGVKVVLPEDSDIDPSEIAEENIEWIREKRAEYERHRERAPNRAFEEGEEFPLLGEPRELSIEAVEEYEIGSDHLALPKEGIEDSSVQTELEKLYRTEARRHFRDRIECFADRMNVDHGKLELRNQRTRWASCSPQKTLSFNWRLIMAPPEVIDYVVVHELAHLIEKNHTRRFWRIVSEYDPDYRDHSDWLDENSARLIFTKDDL